MDELANRNAAVRRYAPGEKLGLITHDPSEPFGLVDFPPFQDDYQPRSLQPTAEELKLKKPQLKIVEPLRAGRDVGSQILVCKVVRAPTDRSNIKKHAPFPSFPKHSKVRRGDSFVVAKVFDPRLYPPRDTIDLPNEPPFDDATVAYSELCREAAVYQFFYEKGKSGHPHMIAQYYGCWVNNRRVFEDAVTPDTWVGLILIEYIEGLSIKAMCTRDRRTGYLQPPLGRPVSLHSDHEAEGKGQAKMLTLDRQVCLDAIKDLLGQVVVCMHLGVSVPDIFPRNVFLTIRNNGHDLETPRVVLLDHTFSTVWAHSRPGKEGVPAPFGDLELPPHPWEQCCVSAVSEFLGWIPPQWNDRKWLPAKTSPAATAPATGRASDVPGVTEETDWLLDCFGPLNDSNLYYTVYPEEVSDSGEEDEEGVDILDEEKPEPDVETVIEDASIPQGPCLRPARIQGISSRSPTRKAEAEGGEGGGGGEQELSMTSTSLTSQIANSPSRQYLGGLIVREATGSGSDNDDEQQQQKPPARS
ncbi:hypothetical protein COL516b_008767 [Colletotrichum fioriniae]|nr:uncharacterized protein COL516b_008767 [Colletotrichum fioriniae]KAJ0300026.1 hypothetical protein COL516b_008767 [Colletotrichum fioriniae]